MPRVSMLGFGKMKCVEHHGDLKCLPNPKWYPLRSQIQAKVDVSGPKFGSNTTTFAYIWTGGCNLEGFNLFVTDLKKKKKNYNLKLKNCFK